MNDEQILDQIEQYAIQGLMLDSSDHKQWVLEKIANLACNSRDCSAEGLKEMGIVWTPGKAP